MTKIASEDGFYDEQIAPEVTVRRQVIAGGAIPDDWDYPSEGDTSTDEAEQRKQAAIEEGTLDEQSAQPTEEAKVKE
jgi:hypothetical protein